MACDPLPSHGVCRLSNPFRSPSPTHHSKCDVQTICRSPRVMCKHSGSAPLPVVAALCCESGRLLFLPFPSSSTTRPKLLAWCHTRKRRHSFSLGQTWMASTHILSGSPCKRLHQSWLLWRSRSLRLRCRVLYVKAVDSGQQGARACEEVNPTVNREHWTEEVRRDATAQV